MLDFSIAKVFPEGLNTTAGSAGLGTPAYMAPEQLSGAPADPRFDVYALGITIWQMLAGKNPFDDPMSRQQELIRRQIRELPLSLESFAGLAAVLDALLVPALAKRPEARYATMAALAKAISFTHTFLENEATAGRMAQRGLPGEPSVNTDPKGRRDYLRPVLVLEPDEAIHITASRVVIGELPEDLRGTVPLGPRPGVGGTVPLATSLPALVRPVSPSLSAFEKKPISTPPPGTPANSADVPASELFPTGTARRSPLAARVAALVIAASLVVVGGLIAWAGARRPPGVRSEPVRMLAAPEPTAPLLTLSATAVIDLPPAASIAPVSTAPHSQVPRADSTASTKRTDAPSPTFTPLFQLPKK